MSDEFIVGWNYADGYSAFFEQDDATGYLYVSKDGTIFQHMHIYNRTVQRVQVHEADVAVLRSQNGSKIGVAIWRELRGIIRLETKETFKQNEGITDKLWLSGFEYVLRHDSQGVTRAFIQCQ